MSYNPAMLSALLALALPCLAAERSAEFISETYVVDRIYKSMLGPHSLTKVSLLDSAKPELLWITGFETEIVDADGKTPQKKEFMCHINLDADLEAHKKLFGWTKVGNDRFFTLSQGQSAIKFPEGFGLPVMSSERFDLFTQVLNHNYKTGKFLVRHKVTIRYRIGGKLKPLFVASPFVMALLEGPDGNFGEARPSEAARRASCDPGLHAPGAPLGTYSDPFGRKLTGHWLVKPGREVRHTPVTRIMNLPFDTTLHYAAAHLHPFAESLELRDLTADRSIFKTQARGPAKGIGLEHVDHFSSAKGAALFKDHEYELVSVYNNTSGADQDSMASMFLYLLDKEFSRP